MLCCHVAPPHTVLQCRAVHCSSAQPRAAFRERATEPTALGQTTGDPPVCPPAASGLKSKAPGGYHSSFLLHACHLSLCLCAATAVPAVRMPMQQSLCYARKAQMRVRVLLLCLLLLCWSIDDDDRVSADSWLAGRLAVQPWQVSAFFAGCGSGQQRCNVYTGLLAWSGSKFVAQIMLAC